MITRFFWSILGLVVLLAAAPRPANAREEALMAACDGKGSTVFFGDIALAGDDTSGTGNSSAVGGTGAAASAKRAVNVSDPARLKRIHAAKMPPITRPIQFCDPAADAICAAGGFPAG